MAETNSRLLKNRTSKLEKEFLIELKTKGYISNKQISKYTVDYVNESTKHIIEINGDYWHCNPKLYKADYYNSSIGMSAAEKWKYDIERKIYLENLGYTVTIIWESDYKKKKKIK
jgi:very-short-patch-repair endonuclease